MAQENNNTESKQFKHLSQYERGQIFALIQEGYSIRKIGRRLNRHHSTISRELKRGTVTQKKSFKVKYQQYYPETGQLVYEKRKANSGPKFKLELAKEMLDYLVRAFKEKKWGIDAIIGYLKTLDEWKDKVILCPKTIYNYIDKGLIQIKNIDLPMKLRVRKRSKNVAHKKNKKVLGKSISERPAKVDSREELGHWEIDTILGSKKRSQALLTLVERKSRLVKIVKLECKNTDSITNAINQLKDEYKELFSKVFKTITSDNGSEFSLLKEALSDTDTEIYFTHPYSSWERGSNERHNGLIRRDFPKGTRFECTTEEELQGVQDRINTTPRALLNYKTSVDVFMSHIIKLIS